MNTDAPSSSDASIDGMLQQIPRLVSELPSRKQLNLVVPGREFRREGTLLMLNEKHDWETMFGYLFDDLLLLCAPAADVRFNAPYAFRMCVRLALVRVEAAKAKRGVLGIKLSMPKDAFELVSEGTDTTTHTLTLRGVHADDSALWQSIIKACVVELVRKEKDKEFELSMRDSSANSTNAANNDQWALAQAKPTRRDQSEKADVDDVGAIWHTDDEKLSPRAFRWSRRLIKAPGTAADGSLHALVDADDKKTLKKLFQQRAKGKATMNFDETDSSGLLPLHRAVVRRKQELVQFLLESMASDEMMLKDVNGNTALHAAALVGDLPSVKLLTQRNGKLVHERNVYGDTPLHCVCEAVSKTVECIDLVDTLVKAGASPNAKNAAGETPLHKLSMNKAQPIVLLQTVVQLLQGGANASAVTEDNESPLHYAARFNRTEVITQLLQAGANQHLISTRGFSAAALARKLKHRDVLEALQATAVDELKRYVKRDGIVEALRLPVLNAALMQALEAKFLGQFVKFYNDAQAFAAIEDDEKRLATAKEIQMRYFHRLSEHEVEVPRDVRRQLVGDITAAPKDFFARAEQAVLAHLEDALEADSWEVKRTALDERSREAKSKPMAASRKLRTVSPQRRTSKPARTLTQRAAQATVEELSASVGTDTDPASRGSTSPAVNEAPPSRALTSERAKKTKSFISSGEMALPADGADPAAEPAKPEKSVSKKKKKKAKDEHDEKDDDAGAAPAAVAPLALPEKAKSPRGAKSPRAKTPRGTDTAAKSSDKEKDYANKVDELQQQLKLALKNEEFEKCVELRDQIKKLKESVENK